MNLNTVTLIGRISKTGPQLRYAENGTPVCSIVVEVDEVGAGGQVFTTYLPVRISGKHAEPTASEVEAGDLVHVSGKLKYESSVDYKLGVKVSKLIVSAWGIQQRERAMTSPGAAADSASDSAQVDSKPARRTQRQPGVAR